MSLSNTLGLHLRGCGRNLLRLLPASWLLTNTMCLLMNSAAVLSLDFVRQISLKSYLGLWGGIYICLAVAMLLPANSRRLRVPVAPSVAAYVAALMLKGALVL